MKHVDGKGSAVPLIPKSFGRDTPDGKTATFENGANTGTIRQATRFKASKQGRWFMADLKNAAADNQSAEAAARAEAATSDLAEQIAILRRDLAKLSETVSTLGQGAKTVVTEEANLAAEKIREKVRDEPILALVATAGIAYLFGLLSRR